MLVTTYPTDVLNGKHTWGSGVFDQINFSGKYSVINETDMEYNGNNKENDQ